MDRRTMRTCLILSIGIVYFTKETVALSCRSCGWNAEQEKCVDQLRRRVKGELEKDLPYPVPDKCIRNENDPKHPPGEEDVEKECPLADCRVKNPACMKWSFISGSPVNITYGCVNNPGEFEGCFEVKISDKDEENDKNTLKKQVCLCKNKDGCNGATFASTSSVFVTAALISAILFS